MHTITDPDAFLWAQTSAWVDIADLTRKFAVSSEPTQQARMREAIARLAHAQRALERRGLPVARMHCAVFLPGQIDIAYFAVTQAGTVELFTEGPEERIYRFDVCSPGLSETLAPLLASMTDTQGAPR
ncbi:hypothetical protein BamIOP4010DRAFT_0626 [Burkholderia ambifaria IOP40-10]|uniref:Uncharacterized protein n=1 Tax=Burkholderia ambifaria IOP40-10 TaxID=396596 RepID=B1F9B7_9BURK|nr:hypothetical protein [Burkholderia ambifaria]EDT05889.1 hypothetical protein BamIOP4010DRAFT_0626 [Burkholderia ambifaria IOP40-10]